MSPDYRELNKLQKLVLDILNVERNHRIPGTDRRENVVEHSFSVALLCWRVYEIVKSQLDLSKIFKYALVHDFTERGQRIDVNTYATDDERSNKKILEDTELIKISEEFGSFPDFVSSLRSYERREDEESLFVWSVDKLQQILLGEVDSWRPYKICEISFEQFCKKNEEFLVKCSPYVKEIFQQVFEYGKESYYDNPKNKI